MEMVAESMNDDFSRHLSAAIGWLVRETVREVVAEMEEQRMAAKRERQMPESMQQEQEYSICHCPPPQHPQSPLPSHLQPRGQQRQTHLRQQLAEDECPRLQRTETEIWSDLRRRQIPDKDRTTPSQ